MIREAILDTSNILNVKIKTGEEYCQICSNYVAVRIDTKETDAYWEVSIYCKKCGSFIYSYNVYK